MEGLLTPGPLVVALAVFLDQVGVPLPALPVLLLAGAAIAAGDLDPATTTAVAVAAATAADLLWYAGGRRYGGRVLGLLCRLSLSPDVCVRQAETLFERHGLRVLLIAKFLPGIAAVGTAMAGTTRAPLARFLPVDAVGAILWVGACLAAGYVFADAVAAVVREIDSLGTIGGAVLAAALVAYVALRAWRRWAFARALRMARIGVEELRERLDGEPPPLVIDARSALRQTADERIPGAVSLPRLDADFADLGLTDDREVVIYCACPNEASAVAVARRLHAAGFRRVRPLAGGIDAWRAAGYVTEPTVRQIATPR